MNFIYDSLLTDEEEKLYFFRMNHYDIDQYFDMVYDKIYHIHVEEGYEWCQFRRNLNKTKNIFFKNYLDNKKRLTKSHVHYFLNKNIYKETKRKNKTKKTEEGNNA